MEQKSSTKIVRSFNRWLPIAFTFLNDVVFTFGAFFLKTLKCSSGQVECSFENPAKTISTNARKFFPQNFMRKFFAQKEIIIKSQFFQENSSKSSSGHVECSFENRTENFPPKVRKNSLKVQEKKIKF